MKIIAKTFRFIVALAAVAMITACSGNGKEDNSAKAEPISVGADGLINIRYIDADSVLRNYNLAKDLNEAMMRAQDSYANTERAKAGELEKFAQAIEQNMRTNNYLSEAAARADQQKFQKMQNDAQNYLGQLQQELQNELLQNNIQLNDSIDNFLKEYNKVKHYDMILKKEATVFIDEKYDITKEVIEGLNKRYVKVEKK